MEVVRRYFSAGYDPSLYQIVKLTFCRSVVNVCSFFSFTVLLATIVFYSVMHNKLEMTIIKGAGISPFRILKSLFIAVSFLGLLYITVFDGLSVYSYRNAKDTNSELKNGDLINKKLTITNKGIWLRDTFQDRAYIISARGFNRKNSSLFNVRIFEFGVDNDLIRSVHADKVTISEGNWNLSNCKVVTSSGAEMIQESFKFPTKLSYSNINRMVKSPDSVSFWSITKYISMLDKVGLSSMSYKIHWYSRLSTIFQMFAFVVIGTAFCINQNSRNRKSYATKVALLMSFAFPVHFITNVVKAYGESGAIPLPVAAFIVPTIILFSGILLVAKK